MKKLILIDGNSIFFRAYYATAYSGGTLMQSKEGVYTNGLFAFVNMMEKILEEDFTHICVAFDTNKPTKRHLVYEDYKAGRAKMPEEMVQQIPLIHEYLKYKGIYDVAIEGYEADDIIGTLSKLGNEELEVEIYSSDKDLLQLINKHVTVRLLKKGMTDIKDMTPESFQEEYGISYEYMVDLKGLMGDPSDNIPGLPGVGEKTAIKLIKEYGNIDQIMANKHLVKGKLGETLQEKEDYARKSYDLSKIDTEVPLTFSLDNIKKNGVDVEGLTKFYQKLDLHVFIKRREANIEKEEFNYTKLNTIEELESVIENNMAVHIELYDTNYHTSSIVGFGLSNGKKHYYVSEEIALSSKGFTNFLESDRPKITYDYKAFKVAMKWRGFDLNGVTYDMMLAAYLYDAQIAKSEFKVLCGGFNYNEVEYDELVYGKGAKKALPEEEVYASNITKKAKAIFKLKDTILDKLKEHDQLDLLNDIEIPLSKVLANMEFRGLFVDQEELQTQKKDLNSRIKTLEAKIHELAGKEFNINSPKQLGEILFVDLGLDTGKKTKGKSFSTSAEVLNELKDAHPIVNYILEYRQLTKLYSTYIEGIEQALFKDSKVHTIYAQALTATGRLSSLEPNLQNIPIRTEEGRQIRKFFKADNNDYLMSADYSQIELRVLAHMSDSPQLISDFNHNKDIHIETAKKVFGSEEVSSDERRKAKAVNFGIIYGIGAWSLSDDIQTTPKEAQAFIDRYFEIYPEIKTFMDNVVEGASNDGFVKTIMNRRRYIPELKSPIFAVKSFGKRTAMNAPIQGSAADIIKKAMIDLDAYLTDNQLKSTLVLQVHDELVLNVVPEEVELLKDVLPKVMNNAVKLKVTLKTSNAMGKTWYELD